MKLYLVQHAKAASKDVDPERSLTKEGLRDIRKVAEFIKYLNLRIDLLWHSGKKRAAQTAEVLAEAVEAMSGTSSRDGLAPNDDVTSFKDELMSLNQDIMVIGHLPFLGKLSSLLLTGRDSADTVAFRQGGIVCMERLEQNQWQVCWMVTPDILA